MTTETGWFDDRAATFGDRLAAARTNLGLSQKQLAKSIGVKTSTLASWENDTSEPRANRLQMLSGILGVSLGWLLTSNGDGIEAPEGEIHIPEDVSALLIEMCGLRSEMQSSALKLGKLEKRLQLALSAAS
ncbi:helix-turn-helix domain-containing protein [Cognatishimia maritima]|uniref:Transcriptional regulator, XRE family n=1 Tax=Cognatishimia maritima TaxID=870908 RepID=A0A1M5J2Z3_9RHOB|nr:helix-turn-helix domain-containing protein [Cognatishimia maritima]SHG34725.1 transcriptional regulator, XRE family [Cognatishimia maritima]